MRLRHSSLFVVPLLLLPFLASSAHADTILGTDLSTFAILGGAGVAINGTGSVITGSIGSYPNVAPTAITGTMPTNFTQPVGTVQIGGGTAISAQNHLGTAINGLSGMTPSFAPISSLGTITLGPGIYSAPSGLTLTGGAITLDGGGNANALWVFQVGSGTSLAVQSNTVVNVINTGSGAGLYWVIPGGSAALDPNVAFQGNILANVSITLATNDTDPCGRLLTQTASVTLAGTNVVGAGCSNLLIGSSGLSGGGTLITSGGTTTVTAAAFQPVPESSTLLLLPSGLIGLAALYRRRQRWACPN